MERWSRGILKIRFKLGLHTEDRKTRILYSKPSALHQRTANFMLRFSSDAIIKRTHSLRLPFILGICDQIPFSKRGSSDQIMLLFTSQVGNGGHKLAPQSDSRRLCTFIILSLFKDLIFMTERTLVNVYFNHLRKNFDLVGRLQRTK